MLNDGLWWQSLYKSVENQDVSCLGIVAIVQDEEGKQDVICIYLELIVLMQGSLSYGNGTMIAITMIIWLCWWIL